MPDTDTTIDLLGAIAYGELCAFDRLAADSRMAPHVAGRVAMSSMAADEFGHFRLLAERLTSLGADPTEAMAPFVGALETYHSLTQPSTWLESVVKAYVGNGMAADFFREIAEFTDTDTRELILEVVNDFGRAEFAVREVSAALAEEPKAAGRLALWGRRLVGEAISQTQHVIADRPSLMALMVSGTGDIAGIAELMARLTDRHVERMKALGLDG